MWVSAWMRRNPQMYRMYGMPRAHGEGMDARSRVMQEQLPNAQERQAEPV